MSSIYKKAQYIYREEGVITFLDRAFRISIVMVKRMMKNKSSDFERWAQIKCKFEGRRAFLIGNGPSLNKLPLYLSLFAKNELCRFFR